MYERVKVHNIGKIFDFQHGIDKPKAQSVNKSLYFILARGDAAFC